MKVHDFLLDPEQFTKITDGHKTIESRLYDTKRQKIRMGDRITFTNRDNTSQTLTVRVDYLLRFNTFADLFEDVDDPSRFGASSNQELLDEIRHFYTYEDEQRNGVVGIVFTVVL